MADLSKLRFNGTDYNVKDASAPLRKFINYSKTGNLPITSDDTTQTAIGKLEKALDSKINTSAKGTASGVAELDANGKVPSSQLPSYVDDVLEYSAKSSFPATGETGKIYVDTTTNKTYRWSGSAYVEISESLALGETSSTAYRGDRGKAAYDHSQITNGNPHGTTGANTNLTGYSKGSSKDAVAATDTVNAAIAKHENRIDANQSNILYALNRTGKNLLRELPTQTINGVTLTNNGDGTYTITRTATSTSPASFIFGNNDNGRFTGCKMTGGASGYGLKSRTLSGAPVDISTDWTTAVTISATAVGDITVNVESSENPQNVQIRPFACDAEMYAKDPSFTMPALPNYDLTRLEAEDRAGLVECVDGGAKNKVNIVSPTATIGNITFTHNSDGSITVNGTANNTDTFYYLTSTTGNSQQSTLMNVGSSPCVLTGCPSGGAANTHELQLATNSGDYRDRGTGIDIPANSSGSVVIAIRAGYAPSNLKFYPMICTKAAFGVSQKFVPYRVPYSTLGKLKKKQYNIELSSVTFTKSYGGVYYYFKDVTDDFSEVISVTIRGFQAVPNKGYTPYTENGTTVGLMVYDADAPATLTFSDGRIYLNVVGYAK